MATIPQNLADSLAEEAAIIASRAAPCTDSFTRINGKCFQTVCNVKYSPKDPADVIKTTSCQTIAVGVRQCARDGYCASVGFDNRTKQCVLISEDGGGIAVQQPVARYNGGSVVGDLACG